MARKKDLTEAAQNATRAIFGTAAGVTEVEKETKKIILDASKIKTDKLDSVFDRLTEGLPIKSEDELQNILQAASNKDSYNEMSDRLLQGISTGHNTVDQLASIMHVEPEEIIIDVLLTRLFKMFPQDAPEDAQKPKKERPKTTYERMKEQEKKDREAGRLVTVHAHILTEEELKNNTAVKATKAADQKPKQKNRTKPNSDYIRLDMKTEEADLKKYVSFMAGVKGVSMTKYVQDLIIKDMKKNEGKTFSPGK